ncbi:hypothetical protein CISECK367B_10215 [Citrobacter sedlakii]
MRRGYVSLPPHHVSILHYLTMIRNNYFVSRCDRLFVVHTHERGPVRACERLCGVVGCFLVCMWERATEGRLGGFLWLVVLYCNGTVYRAGDRLPRRPDVTLHRAVFQRGSCSLVRALPKRRVCRTLNRDQSLPNQSTISQHALKILTWPWPWRVVLSGSLID